MPEGMIARLTNQPKTRYQTIKKHYETFSATSALSRNFVTNL